MISGDIAPNVPKTILDGENKRRTVTTTIWHEYHHQCFVTGKALNSLTKISKIMWLIKPITNARTGEVKCPKKPPRALCVIQSAA